MGKLWRLLKEHGEAITAVVLLAGIALYAGNLQQRVASAEEQIKSIESQVIRADRTGEDRVVRIHDKLEGFSKKLDEFTREQRDHMLADAGQYREIAVTLQGVSDDLKAIREDIHKRSTKK